MRARVASGREVNGHVRGRSLTQDVHHTFLGWIRESKYPPGSQLPSVQELGRHFGVSRTVVREALQSLSSLNLIEMRPGVGCFVRTISPELVINSDVLASLLEMESIVQVVMARKVIESGIAKLAAVTATEEDFEEIEDVLRKIERAANKNQFMYSITPMFHVAVARATHNKVLEKIVSSFNLLMASGGALLEEEGMSHNYRRSEYESHRMLYEVLRTRDPERAQHAMEEHIDLTLNGLKQIAPSERTKPASTLSGSVQKPE